MLILGGAGRLYGGLVGAIIFMVARDQLAGMNPQYLVFLARLAADGGDHLPAKRHSRAALSKLLSPAERRHEHAG